MGSIASFMHFIMTLLTYGLWLPVWIVCEMMARDSHKGRMLKLQKENNELLRKIHKNSR